MLCLGDRGSLRAHLPSTSYVIGTGPKLLLVPVLPPPSAWVAFAYAVGTAPVDPVTLQAPVDWFTVVVRVAAFCPGWQVAFEFLHTTTETVGLSPGAMPAVPEIVVIPAPLSIMLVMTIVGAVLSS